MAAGNKQVSVSLVDALSSTERLGKLTVSGDHTKDDSSDLARARSSAINTEATTTKTLLDDSVRGA